MDIVEYWKKNKKDRDDYPFFDRREGMLFEFISVDNYYYNTEYSTSLKNCLDDKVIQVFDELSDAQFCLQLVKHKDIVTELNRYSNDHLIVKKI
jgi:hypothetical protein